MTVHRGNMQSLHQLKPASSEVVEILGIGNGGEAAVIAPQSETASKVEIYCKDAAAARMESPGRPDIEVTNRVKSRSSVFPLFLVVPQNVLLIMLVAAFGS